MPDGDLLNKVATAAIIGLLGWNLATTQGLSIDLAVLTSKVDTSMTDRFTGVEAVALETHLNSRLDRVEQWSQNLSNRLASIENDMRETNLQ